MNSLLLIPPIAFLILVVAMLLQLRGMRIFSAGLKKPERVGGRLEPYACGEDAYDHRAQPDYSQFFPFAFFFTIMHVVALILATLPKGSMGASLLAGFYLIAAAVGLVILFRR